MRVPSVFRRVKAGSEAGFVLIQVAIALPAVLLLISFVVDVGNWWVHKRHLQIQADAAALAGAGNFVFPECDDDVIESAALLYGGKTGSGHNMPALVRTPDDELHMGGDSPGTYLNRPSFYGRSEVVDADLADNPTPCESGIVDVKMTETNAPWYFRALSIDWIDAQARVEVQKAQGASGLLPFGVPDVEITKAKVEFFNKATGALLGSSTLAKSGSENGMQMFDNIGTPVAVTVPATPAGTPPNASMIGTRIAITSSTAQSPNLDCAQDATDELLQCFPSGLGTTPPANSRYLAHYRGTTTPMQGSGAPSIGNVVITPHTASCTVGEPDNGYFHKTCTQLDVSVDVAGGWTATGAAAKRVRIRYVTGAPNGNQGFTLANPQNLGGSPTVWRFSGSIDVTQAHGNYDLYLRIDQNGNQTTNPPCNGPNPCQSGVIHRTNAAGETTSVGPDAGPIEMLDLYDGPSGSAPTLSNGNMATGAQRELAVEIGVSGHLELADPGDPPVSLKVTGQNQTQGLDCDDAVADFVDEVANGCGPTYILNTGEVCDPDLSPASALWATAEPWPCVAVATGQFTNKANKGLNIRILCRPANSVGNCKQTNGAYDGKPAECTNPNNWPDYTPDDPRIVTVFVTPADSFEGNGSQSVPVINFASFYVTGWSGQGSGFSNPCEGNGDEPDPIPDGSNVYGHWIKYVLPNTGGGTGEACDFSNVGSCVAVMTK